MSVNYRAVDWAFDQDLPREDKLLLVYIAKCTDEDDLSFPSVKLMAAKCGVSPRTIQRALSKFCELGLVAAAPRYRKDGSQTSNLYTINMKGGVTVMSSPHDTTETWRGDKSASSPRDNYMSPLELPNKTKLKKQLQNQASGKRTLFYPQGLTSKTTNSINKILQQIPDEAAQVLLDELAGAMAVGFIEKIKSPEQWFFGMAANYRRGQFKPSCGIEITRARKKLSIPKTTEDVTDVQTVDKELGNKYLSELRPRRSHD